MDDPEEKIWLSQIPKAERTRFRPKTISSILDRLIVERGYSNEQSTLLLQEQWKIAVGDEFYSQSRVGKIKRGVLQVLVTNMIVISELEFGKQKALRHLQASLPDFKLKDIRFVLAK
ncbi:MAG: DUF721 domain-containing protein [Pirellula sp.]